MVFIPSPPTKGGLVRAVSLFFSPVTNPGVRFLPKTFRTKVDELELDATLSETHSGEVEVTEHPVEAGANVVDHLRPKPNILSIEGVISNTPIPQADRDKLGTMEKGAVGRAEAAFVTLRQLKEAGRLIEIRTRLEVYRNMVLTNLSVPRDPKLGDVVRFSATFKQVRIVQLRTVALETRRRTQKPAANKGPQATKDVTEAHRNQSILSKAKEEIKTKGLKGAVNSLVGSAM